jgi:HPt (histidine-containing phosphotransfer) domain-containing protein
VADFAFFSNLPGGCLSAKEKMMLFDQITNNEVVENDHPFRPASASAITNDAVDMELLNAFEELQLDDGSDLIVELIDLYLPDAAQRVSQIREASLETEWTLLKRTAHALKGSSGNLGVRHVAEICENLERMDGHDSPQTVAVLVRLLEYESAMANSSLAAVRQRRLG